MDDDWLIGTLSEDERLAAEQTVEAAPDDLEARARLLAHHFALRPQSREHVAHAVWFAERSPTLRSHVLVCIDPARWPEEHERARRGWLAAVEREPAKPLVLENAVDFLVWSNPSDAHRVAERATELAPARAALWEVFARVLRREAMQTTGEAASALFARQAEALARARALLKARWRLCVIDIQRMEALFAAGLGEAAGALAESVLVDCVEHERHWFYGNAVFKAHHVLGMLAFDRGDLDEAERQLDAALATRGSPQIGGFGLATALVVRLRDAGRPDVVARFEAAWRRLCPRVELEW